MKYGESTFDILYLLFAISTGIYLLVKHKDRATILFGVMTLLLGVGDAFHLLPRVISYFMEDELIFYKGLGKLITSISMTFFYILLEHARIELSQDKRRWPLYTLYGLCLIRVVLCALPYNDWFISPSSYAWGIYRNIPFVLMGILSIYLWFTTMSKKKPFSFFYLFIGLSFAFYLVTVLGASYVSILGMMMLPKTVCYILMMVCFLLYVQKLEDKKDSIMIDE
ncbi:MAG: hypothetical protein IJ194_00765 [Bacilli bacterium]|jgi:hypothetical protein|nr:hypothetical protein [Bacilli bacterium]